MTRLQRGDLYLLKPDADGKQRPIFIVSRDSLNGGHAVLAVPFYSQQLEKRKRQQWCALFAAGEGGLSKDCVAKCDEISSIDKVDIDLAKGRVGRFLAPQMERLTQCIKWSLRLRD